MCLFGVVAFLLSKLLPLLVLPLGLALLLLLLGLIRRRRWPVGIAFLLLWLFSTGLVSQMLWRVVERPWQRRPAGDAPGAARSPAPRLESGARVTSR